MISVSSLAGFGWLSASQSFVTLGRNDQLVHPSRWQWPFWVCVAGAVIGLYIVLTTYHDGLPMFGRERLVDHSTMYSLALVGLEMRFNRAPGVPGVGVRAGLVLTNGGPSVIEMTVEDLEVTVMDKSPDNPTLLTNSMRILPGHVKFFAAPWVLGIEDRQEIQGKIKYKIRYGPPSGSPAYLRSHEAVFASTGPIDPEKAPGVDWYSLTPEQDDVIEGSA